MVSLQQMIDFQNYIQLEEHTEILNGKFFLFWWIFTTNFFDKLSD